jgi:hypothetical protein
MKLFALYSFMFILSVGVILLLNNKHTLVSKIPTSNFKRKALLAVKEENSMVLILSLCALETVLVYLFGKVIF